MTTTPLWTAAEVLDATAGRLVGEPFAATGVTFDSREVQPGDLFVALKGVRDGHEFVAQAFASGAAAALVERPVEGGACVVVEDGLKGLERLGAFARDRAPQSRRGAITGSVGKTSVTQAVALGLRLAGPSHTSVKSFNNHIGVPLTLARMPRETERAVFEIGMNHADEIRPLVKMVQPQAAMVTTVGPVHVENFADGEAGVARAKAEIFEGLGPGGLAIVNADNVWFDFLREVALKFGARIATFGSGEEADARLLEFAPDDTGARVRARVYGSDYVFRLRQSGFHWGLNSLATLLMLDALDVPIDTALHALEAFEPLAGRGQEKTVRIECGAFTLVDESYNANPLSMAAGFKNLGARKVEGRKIAVVTDMLELGDEGPKHHAALAEHAESAEVALVFCAGPLSRHAFDALSAGRRGGWAETAAELAPMVTAAVRPGDVVMVKGSNGSRASLVAKALADLDRPAAEVG